MQPAKKIPQSALALADMIIDSQLLAAENVRSLFAAFETISTDSSAKAFAEFLASRGDLTRWQTEKLCNGQWKGFIVDHFRLDEHISNDETHARYAATDMRWDRRVVLAIVPFPRPPRYVVEEPEPRNPPGQPETGKD
jgi:hypothetical protein